MPSTNPTKLTWVNPTTREDGTPYAQGDNAGYEIQIDGQGAVGIPVAWGTSFDLPTLQAYQALKSGTHTLALDAVSKEGLKSNFSAATSFLIAIRPSPPTNLVLS